MKKTLTLILATMFCVFMFAGCGGDNGATDTSSPSTSPDVIASTDETTSQVPGGDESLITIKVGATPAPHAEMLNLIKDDMLGKGIVLEVEEFNDYVIPNTALDEGSLDANFFQHIDYLNNFNEENGTELVSIAEIHYEPMCIYGGKSSDLANIKDGAIIAVPNDGTNEARALAILEAEGLIKIKEGAGLKATIQDIEDNPKNLDIKEMEAAQLPISLPDVDFAVINGNFAISNNLTMDQALAVESADAAPTFINVLVVRAGNESKQELQILAEMLQSQKVKDFLDEKYGGAVVAVFGTDEPTQPTPAGGETSTPTHPGEGVETSDQPTHPSEDAGTVDTSIPTHPSQDAPVETGPTSPDEE